VPRAVALRQAQGTPIDYLGDARSWRACWEVALAFCLGKVFLCCERALFVPDLTVARLGIALEGAAAPPWFVCAGAGSGASPISAPKPIHAITVLNTAFAPSDALPSQALTALNQRRTPPRRRRLQLQIRRRSAPGGLSAPYLFYACRLTAFFTADEETASWKRKRTRSRH
jgi:hypothetical protein